MCRGMICRGAGIFPTPSSIDRALEAERNHRYTLDQYFYGERIPSFPEPTKEERAIYDFAKWHCVEIALRDTSLTILRNDTPNAIYYTAVVEFPDWVVSGYHRFVWQAEQKRKYDILNELYKTGMLNGRYFTEVCTIKSNPIKTYIKNQMYRNQVTPNADLIEDCYNEAFYHLYKKTASKICEIYDESPNKLIATALRIISSKCFAKDPRYNNPRHSLVQGILFCSMYSGVKSLDGLYDYIDNEHLSQEDVSSGDLGSIDRALIVDPEGEDDTFKAYYGFTIEEIVARLNPQQKATFYGMIGAQPRGKVSATKQRERDELTAVLLKLKEELS